MGLRLRSLSEDAVDTYTHVWSVLAFLFLAFILLLVPSKETEISAPSLEAICWCPPGFSQSQIHYTNTYCSAYLTSLAQGNADMMRNEFREPQTPADDEKKSSEENEKHWFVMGSVRAHCAFFLFVLALCLGLPRMLWAILSGCCDSVNIGRTLQSAEKGSSMSHNVRQQQYSGLVKAFIDYTRTSRNTATYLYLIMKIFMIIVIIVEIIVICVSILPEVQEFSWSGPIDKVRVHKQLPIFLCRVQVTFGTYQHSIQCYLTERAPMPVSNPMIPSNVFLIVLANLVLLFIVNVLNTLLWAIRLSRESSHIRLGLPKDSPLDLVFLIQMARVNLGIEVAVGLAESVSGGQLAKGDGEETLLMKNL